MKQHWSNEHSRCEVVENTELPPEMRARVREVVRVWTDREQRQQGYATQLMQSVCEEADCEGLILILQPRGYDSINAIGKDKLVAWYKRFGFVVTQPNPVLMARAPTFKVRQSMVGAAVEQVTRG